MNGYGIQIRLHRTLYRIFWQVNHFEQSEICLYRTHYVNNDDKQIKIDNLYRQKEIYFSANEYELFSWWKVSLSYDFMWNDLNADMYGFARPDRFSNFYIGCYCYKSSRFRLQASALGTFIHDRLRGATVT